MILADKIIQLRKKNGWSQEELAEKMKVSRQSVSKWEGALSVPDLDKILLLSRLFGVSTDYLLKDELDEEDAAVTESDAEEEQVRRVTMEEANEFLHIKHWEAGRIAFATFLCIISPIMLLLLGAATESTKYAVSEAVAGGIGMTVLLLLITGAVAIFISCGMKTKRFVYLEQELIETEYGVAGMVKEKKKQFESTYARHNVFGTCLCILSVIPIFCGAMFSEDAMVMMAALSCTLLFVGIGVVFFILAGVPQESFQKLLQEEDYTREAKKRKKFTGAVATVYWLIVVAIYLAHSFLTNDWKENWVIWPVAGVLFAALMTVCRLIQKKEK